jgi:hypothetical protein
MLRVSDPGRLCLLGRAYSTAAIADRFSPGELEVSPPASRGRPEWPRDFRPQDWSAAGSGASGIFRGERPIHP